MEQKETLTYYLSILITYNNTNFNYITKKCPAQYTCWSQFFKNQIENIHTKNEFKKKKKH